jgi:hypothetical protein
VTAASSSKVQASRHLWQVGCNCSLKGLCFCTLHAICLLQFVHHMPCCTSDKHLNALVASKENYDMMFSIRLTLQHAAKRFLYPQILWSAACWVLQHTAGFSRRRGLVSAQKQAPLLLLIVVSCVLNQSCC